MTAMRPVLVVFAASLLMASPAAAAPPAVLDLASTGADLSLLGHTGAGAGWSVAAAGDVNGDGIGDTVVGAPHAGAKGAADRGAAYVVFGHAPGTQLADLGALDDGGYAITGAAAGDRAGFSVAPAGDVNGDGRADVLVGAPGARAGAGTTSVVYGKGDANLIALGALGAGGYTVSGATAGDASGTAVAGAGDLDGDGVPDLVTGAPTAAGGRRDAGAAFVVFGRRGGGDADLGALGAGGYRLDGPAGGFAGLSVGAAGDVDGDGTPDLVIGAPAADPDALAVDGAIEAPAGREIRGSAFVVFGRGAGPAVDLATLAADRGVRLRATGDVRALGLSVAGAGDLDGDGAADIAVGAPLSSPAGRKESGSAFVLLGGPAARGTIDLANPGTARVARADGAHAGDALGGGIAGVGDVSGDGRADLAVTAPFADPFARSRAGSGYVVRGPVAAGALDLSKAQAYAGSTPAGNLRAVAGLGDVTGDGAADLAFGEERAAPGAVDATPTGAVRIAYGVAPPKPQPPVPTTADPGRAEEIRLDGCRSATRFELLIDDSGSMADSDPDSLRAKALELLLAKPANAGRTFTAVQFGSDASEIFGPTRILAGIDRDAQVKALSAELERALVADDEGTNYNAGFRRLNREEGRANARIFLTDGEHNEGGDYRNGHRGGPPTYVIGLGLGRSDEAGQRLKRIGRETDGSYFPKVTRENVQAVMNAIDAKVNCDIAFESFVDTLTDKTPLAEPNVTELESGTYSADVNVSWDDGLDDVEPDTLTVVDDEGATTRLRSADLRRAAAGEAVRSGRVTVRGDRGPTFISLRVTGIKGADRLRVRVGAQSVAGKSARVRTQVGQSRRRR